ncbi:MAG: DUF1080 domain-containing protein [Planctomycetes bacterium]|nr:DUF1080 domain-containing protein [Planctomycetota bacterium]
MSRFFALCVVFCLVGCVADGSRSPAGARELFDGHSLAGWSGDARHWRVENGAIVGESTAANPLEHTTYLAWTGGEVADFVLELEWRMQGGNSGVQFRSRASAQETVAGYQADLEDGPDWTGGLYEQDGRGIVTRRGERVVLDATGNSSVERFADGEALRARVDVHQWNRLRITASGPRLTIEVNDELFSETIDLDPAHAARRGALALQLHQGAAMRVEFRDLRLRELGIAAAAPTRAAKAGSEAWDVDGEPQWIWPQGAVADGQGAWFVRDFTLSAAPAQAELWITCDNEFDAWLNGTGVATGDDWMAPLRVDVSAALRAGNNKLLVRGSNRESQAGLCARLTGTCTDGSAIAVESDANWRACLADELTPKDDAQLFGWLDQVQWSAPQSFGGLEALPWAALARAEPAPSFAPAAEAIHVPDGFRVELLHTVDSAREGSWVSLAVDPRGRLYASDQYGGLFRITVPVLGTSGETVVEPVAVALGEAHGLLWAFDALYVVVNGAGKYKSGLYRVRDTDGDDALDQVECLRALDGDGEHGPHGLVLDASGEALLLVAGNYTHLPEPMARYRRPRNWAEDALLPVIPDPNGHAVEIRAPGGWVARTDRDGKEWELVAAGMRNTYDIALNADGEIFAYDSDMEWDTGMPWYKPTRVLHVVSGADYGWRTGESTWPADSYDAWPSAVDLELGSPTGIVFGEQTSFPEPWKSALFACDWAYGRVFAVQLEPEGSTYRGGYELFASGQPFPVTDIVAAPDGALYVTIGGRQTQSGLYRISWDGPAPAASEPAENAGDVLLLREARALLERTHAADALDFGGGPRADDERAARLALGVLGHADPFLRRAGRVALEHLDPALWSESVRAQSDSRAALEGWLALLHAEPTLDAHELVERALGIAANVAGRDERTDALRLLQLALLRLEVHDAERARLRAELDPLYPSGEARFDRQLLALLVTLRADVAGRALDALERAATQQERLALLDALRALEGPWSERDGQRLLAAFERELASLKGGFSARGFVEAMRAQAAEHLGIELVAAPDDGALAPAGAPIAAPGAAGRALHAWTLAALEPDLGTVARGRDFARGRAAYELTSCVQCHRFAGDGANRGPDLTGAAGRYSPRDLLVAILEPSREVPDVWRDTELWGADELLTVGRVEAERADELVVRDVAGERVRLAPALVTERVPHRLSRMPERLLDVLERDEVLDLLAYVLSGGEPADERFR